MPILAIALSSVTGTGFGSCTGDHHRHELQFDELGLPTVYSFPNEWGQRWNSDKNVWVVVPQPDIVMDGLCHDNTSEVPEIPEEERKKLPKPDASA